jgi:predicted phage terminase large subunit-like protein
MPNELDEVRPQPDIDYIYKDEIDPDASQIAVLLQSVPEEERLDFVNSLTEKELQHLHYDWELWARPKQLEPPGDDWIHWLVLAGRGYGKTRQGAEWVTDKIEKGTYNRFHVVGPTAADVRDTMVEGPSGLLAVSRPWNRASYFPTRRQVIWESGAKAICFSADEPERLRGPQCEAAWADELCAWRYLEEAWMQLMLGLRLGKNPRSVITTTPKPSRLLRDLIDDPKVVYVKGSTFENLDNLAPAFTNEITKAYDGKRIGDQELYAEILDDAPGALWKHDTIDEYRVEKAPPLVKVVVGVDPSVTFSESADETGIIIAGLDAKGHAYVLDDVSGKMKVDEWASKVGRMYHRYLADYVIAEKNQGGDMVTHTIQVADPTVSVKLVHASKAKVTRAEPVAQAYTGGLVHHVGTFHLLEQQMCEWEAGDPESPDRLDALVWALTELVVGPQIVSYGIMDIDQESLHRESYWRAI